MDDQHAVIASLRNAVAALPEDLALRMHLAGLLLTAGEPDEAVAHLGAVLQADPGNTQALSLLVAHHAGETAPSPATPDTAAGPRSSSPVAATDPAPLAKPVATEPTALEPPASAPETTPDGRKAPAAGRPNEPEAASETAPPGDPQLKPATSPPANPTEATQPSDPANPTEATQPSDPASLTEATAPQGPAEPAPPADFDWAEAEAELRDVLPPMFVTRDGGAEDSPGTRPDDATAEAGFDAERPGLRLADVAGMAEVKERLEAAFLMPMRNPELRRLYGKSLRGGLLLYGPPGCGKTFIARAVAGELGARF